MEIKLNPPQLKGTVPAFSDGFLQIPFQMNRSVSELDVKGFCIKLRTIKEGEVVLNKIVRDGFVMNPFPSYSIIRIAFNSNEIKKINVGQFYKIQIAYISNEQDNSGNDIIGYFSQVGITKYTTSPKVEIDNLEKNQINNNLKQFIGKYSQKNLDTTEKEYAYCFNVYNEEKRIIFSSGFLTHYNSQDLSSFESLDIFNFNKDLEPFNNYYIEYKVITNNQLIKSSGLYLIKEQSLIESQIPIKILATNNYENAYIELKLQKTDPYIRDSNIKGKFLILKASEKDDFSSWHQIHQVRFQKQDPFLWKWKDFYVEQGVQYKYALQQINSYGILSKRKETDIIIADFEHTYLTDGIRQFKINFNSKINSYKTNVKETKAETLGNKYPIIFRNDIIKYREYQFSGLLSFFSDDENLFFLEKSFKEEDLFSLSQNDSKRIKMEREYREKVLDWLSNGKPKIFKSSSEGNMLVKVLNSVAAPLNNLNRSVCEFNGSCCEIDQYSYENLLKYNLFDFKDDSQKSLKWETFTVLYNNDFKEKNLLKHQAAYLKIEGASPGDKFYINDNFKREESFKQNPDKKICGLTIEIGASGKYEIQLSSKNFISELMFLSSKDRVQLKGVTVTYGYYGKVLDSFDLISDISSETVISQQFFGPIYEENETHLLNSIQDLKNEITDIGILKIVKRPIIQCYYQQKSLYLLLDSPESQLTTINKSCLYKIIYNNQIYYKSGEIVLEQLKSLKELTFSENEKVLNNTCTIKYSNGKQFTTLDFDKKEEEEFRNLEKNIKISFGNGLMIELTYLKQKISYDVEKDSSFNILQQKKNELKIARKNLDDSKENKDFYYEEYQKKYQDYLLELKESIEQRKREYFYGS